MSSDAKQLIRDGVGADLVKDVANKGYYAGSRQIDQEVDLELYINIVRVDSDSWLTIQRGKHRIPGITKPEHLYTVYKFEDIGTIPDDILGNDSSRKRVGGKTASGAGKEAFYDDI